MDSREVAIANAELLRQLLCLLPDLDEVHYSTRATSFMEGTIGQHVRHVLDHYRCFLEGVQTGTVDYSSRQRDRILERNRALAIRVINEQVAALDGFGVSSTEKLQIVHEPIMARSQPAESTVGRELEFLLSHTIHHYALLAIALRASGVSLPSNFGLAFSTVNFRASQTATLSSECL